MGEKKGGEQKQGRDEEKEVIRVWIHFSVWTAQI